MPEPFAAQRRHLARWRFALAFAALALVSLALFALGLYGGHRDTAQDARRTLDNLTRLIESKLTTDFSAASRLVTRMAEEIDPAVMRLGLPVAQAQAIHRRLSSEVGLVPSASALRYFDADGHRLYTSIEGESATNIADRDFFQQLRHDPSLGLVYTDVFVGHYTQRPTLYLVKPVLDAHAGFMGVALAAIDLGALQEQFRKLDIGAHGVAVLSRIEDGALLLRHPELAPSDNAAAASLPGFDTVQRQGATGGFTIRTPVDGLQRMYAFRRLQGHPLYVAVGLAEEDFLEAWRRDVAIAAITYLLFLTALGLTLARLAQVESRRATKTRELQRSEQRLRRLIEHNLAPILQIDAPSGQILEANPAATEFYGWTVEELRAKTIQQINTLPADQVATERLAAASEHRNHFLFQHRLASGETRDVEVYSTPIEIEAQPVLVSIVHDVTARQQVQRRLNATLLEQQAILDSRVVGFVRIGHRHIVWANAAFAEMMGMPLAELIGQPTRRLHVDDDAHAAFDEEALPVLARGEVFRAERRQRRGDGGIGWFDISCSALARSGDELVGAFIDITERTSLESRLHAAAAEIEDLYEHAPCGYHSLDAKGCVMRVNATELAWLGRRRDEVVGRPVGEFFTPEGGELFARSYPRIMADARIDGLEFDLVPPAAPRHVSVSASAITGDDGRFLGSRSVMYDITELHRALDDLAHLSAERLAMLDSDLIGIVKLKDRHILWAGRGMQQLLGHEVAAIIGGTTRLYYTSEEAYRTFGAAAYPLLQSEGRYRTQTEFAHADGRRLWVDVSGTLLNRERDESMWLLIDITAQHRQQEVAEYHAFHDGLTGLPNRVLLGDRLEQALAMARRNKAALAVCYLDLDGFKAINDIHGHGQGDLLLKVVAERLMAVMRNSETVGRNGGDEFVLLLTQGDVRKDCASMLRRVLEEVARPVDLEGEAVGLVSASIGVALYPDHGLDADTLLRVADRAMYQAKQAGGNTFVLSRG